MNDNTKREYSKVKVVNELVYTVSAVQIPPEAFVGMWMCKCDWVCLIVQSLRSCGLVVL